MRRTNMDYRITLLALGLVASAGVLVACGGNACDTYVDDAKAKFDECGISTQSTSAATGGGTCDDASAKLAIASTLASPRSTAAVSRTRRARIARPSSSPTRTALRPARCERER